jgi:hypothetical protein
MEPSQSETTRLEPLARVCIAPVVVSCEQAASDDDASASGDSWAATRDATHEQTMFSQGKLLDRIVATASYISFH